MNSSKMNGKLGGFLALCLSVCLLFAACQTGNNIDNDVEVTNNTSSNSQAENLVNGTSGTEETKSSSEVFITVPVEETPTSSNNEIDEVASSVETSESTTESTTESTIESSSENTEEETTAVEITLPEEFVAPTWTNHLDYRLYNFTYSQEQTYHVLLEAFKKNISPISMPTKISLEEVEEIYSLIKNSYFEGLQIQNGDGNATLNVVQNVDTGDAISLSIDYSLDEDTTDDLLYELDLKTQEILAGITGEMTDWDKVKYFHDYIILNTTYDLNAPNPYSIYGALIEGRAVCEGYAKSFSYLASKVGIETILVTGYAGTEKHMWNMVKLGNNWYHIDLTWDDPVTSLDDDYIQYDYFCIDTNEIKITHQEIHNSPFYTLPNAYSTDANYFVKNDAVINSIDEASEMFVEHLVEASNNSEKYVYLSVGTQTLYNDIVEKYFTNQEISQAILEAHSLAENKFDVEKVSFIVNDTLRTIKLILRY